MSSLHSLSVLIAALAVVAPAEYTLQGSWLDAGGAWHGTLDFVPGPVGGVVVDSAVVTRLRLDAVVETPTRLHVTINDADRNRSTVPQAVLPTPASSGVDCASARGTCQVRFVPRSDGPFSFAAVRLANSGVGVLFDSSAAPLVYQDQFISLATALPPGAKVLGLMEATRTRLELLPGETATMWAADTWSAVFNVNLYGVQPFLVSVSPDGTAHGVLMCNAHGMDIKLSEDGSRLHYRIIGGIVDLYMFSGPTVSDVVAQYTEAVGRPAMMPRWSLGFHNCKWGYRSLGELQAVTANYSKAEIPITTFWVDIDYMDGYRDFTTNPAAFPASSFRAYVERLHSMDQRFVLILDPGIKIEESYAAYSEGLADNVFVQDGFTGAPYTGVVWPGAVHFPDFLHPNTSAWWARQIEGFVASIPVDGLWVDMNEVSNFCNIDGLGQECHLANKSEAAACPNLPGGLIGSFKGHCCKGTDNRIVVCRTVDPGNRLDSPPYRINNSHFGPQNLGSRTLPPSALHYGGVREYDVHSTYGSLMSKATVQALAGVRPERRPFVLSRSTFVGHGAYAAHWLGDNAARWEDLRASVRGILSFSLLGVPMVGSDICGFLGNTTAELCSRWIQVGAFAPFSRVHNSLGQQPQELYRWDSVAKSARAALGLRYRLLPYLYTLFYEAHTQGAMVTRPLFAVFPGDAEAFAVSDGQFMLGDAVLITPVLAQHAVKVRGYFPKGLWYSLVDGQPNVDASASGRWVELETPLDRTNVHVRGGRVLPMQQEVNTTNAAALDLLVALDENGRAEGRIFLDDGEQPSVGQNAVTVDMQVACPALDCTSGSALTFHGVSSPPLPFVLPLVRSVRILGVQAPPPGWTFSFGLSSSPHPPEGKYNPDTASILFEDLSIQPLGFHSLFWRAVPPAADGAAATGAARRLRGEPAGFWYA